ncbi:MAG: 4Fe-4S binding protein [Woeseiaceae bacterium]|nr:4Fe-4S binding protein [Woeseiaceae bacterium]
MAALRNVAIQWYRQVFGAPAGSDIRDEGLDGVLDGSTAVALSEAAIATHAVCGGSTPMAEADEVWQDQLEHGATNLFGEPLAAQTAEGPRGAIAAATGLALAGRRATAFLSGRDIGAAQDLLIAAAGKHTPFVLHVEASAAAAHGAAPGSGHETIHLSADSGCFVLFAANVQEAVDFTFIARRVAETSLVPGLVAMDSEQTALAAQDVRLLSPAQASDFIGAARERIEAPTAAQKLLFGDTRRRVPAWHDLDEPVLTGALFDRNSFALGAFARRPFFDTFVADALRESFERFAAKTGRHHEPLTRYRTNDAKLLLVAQGSAIETAQAAADCLRKQHKIKAGVIGIRALRPFPAAELAAEFDGCKSVLVLERTNAPIGGEPPLTREVRASLADLGSKRRPHCTPALYGLGGLPLRLADLVELAARDELHAQGLWYLGVAFDDDSGDQPKREVLLDALRRAYPDLDGSAIRASQSSPAAPGKSLSIAIRRSDGGEELLGAAAALLHALEGGRVRTHPDVAWPSWSAASVDRLVHGETSLQDPGPDVEIQATLDVPGAMVSVHEAGDRYQIPIEGHGLRGEKLLGGLFGALIKAGLLDHKARRVIAARKGLLANVAAEQRDSQVAAFQAGLENVVKVDASAAATEQTRRWAGAAPAAVRHLAREDNTFASLPRFWDQTGVLYRDGQAGRLTADPFLATGTMPPLSSTFNDTGRSRTMLPAFDPALCTGCGQCWTLCPDSAIGVVAATPAALIDAGIGLTGADAVRQVASKLGPRIISANRKAGDPPPTFGEMLEEAYAWLGDKMPLPDDRKQAISEGIVAIGDRLGSLPVAVTKPFFADAEAARKDSAELLSIVINPEACKACGICIGHCEPEALQAAEQDADTLAGARDLWSVYTNTPDTTSETLERVAENPDIGEMAAILLSRYCQFALAGGDAAEAGSGEKMATRLALAVTEFHQQPISQRFAQSLDEAGDAISGLIEKTLSSTLSIDDLDAITDRLKRTRSPRVDLEDLAKGIGDDDGDHSIDTDYLLRLIDLYNRIDAARHRIVEGAHGLGRARYGLAVAGGSAATWAGAFPHNPFQAPVVIDMTGSSAQLAAGLVEGHLEETTELVRLLRLAQLEIEQPDGADWQRDALTRLHWQDLDDNELALCPPLVLLGSDELLAGRGLSQLVWLLNAGLPVKVLVFSGLEISDPRADLGLLALAQRNAFVASSSVADAAHLGASMLQALSFHGAALLQVYAPSPARHGFPADQSAVQARLAVASRALPLFRYDPRADGVFGSRISLDGNPAPADAMADITLADWALGQQRFAAHFEPLPDDAGSAVPMNEWLLLDTKARRGKTPYVVAAEDTRQRYAVSALMADSSSERLAAWQTLQELAGIVTPFTARLEQDIRAELAAEHQAQLDAQQQASAAELREVEEKTQAEIARNIRSRLLQLATRKRN